MKTLLIIITVIAISACSAKPDIVKHAEDFTGSGRNEVFVVSHGWHTGLILSAAPIQERMPALQQRFGNTLYIEFGWGDKGFYQAKEITSGLTLRAIFWPTESVMHVVSVPEDVYAFFPASDIEKLCLSDSEFVSLAEFIINSFYRDNKGRVVELKNGLYGDSQFYKGVGDYYLMNTCNKWTAKGLKSTGMDISTTFKLTAGSVMGYIKDLKLRSVVASICRS